MPRPRKPFSYAAYFMGPGFAPEGHTNALRFATEKEAADYAACLYQRWTMPTGYEIRPTADPVTHTWNRDTRTTDPAPIPQWRASIAARKAGAIGTLDAEKRTYTLPAMNVSAARDEAIRLGHADGLEHVTVIKCRLVGVA